MKGGLLGFELLLNWVEFIRTEHLHCVDFF